MWTRSRRAAHYNVQLPNFDIAQARIQADTAATFVTIAGTNLPRVTAKTTYEKNRAAIRRRPPKKIAVRSASAETWCSTRSTTSCTCARLNLTVGKTQWALPPGQEATAKYSNDSVTLRKFRARARPAAGHGGGHRRHRRRFGERAEQPERATRQRAGAGHQRAAPRQSVAGRRAQRERGNRRHAKQSASCSPISPSPAGRSRA